MPKKKKEEPEMIDVSCLVKPSTFARLYGDKYKRTITDTWVRKLIRDGRIQPTMIDGVIFIDRRILNFPI